MSKPKVIWVTPEDQGGIRDYSDTLSPYLASTLEDQFQFESLNPILSKRPLAFEFVKNLKGLKPSLIHIQHEFGLFGSKTPPFYTFPYLVDQIRKEIPEAKIVATGHSIYNQEHRYILEATGWQYPFRLAMNVFALPYLRRLWTKSTWGICDAVIVHSVTQLPVIEQAGCLVSTEIPLYVLKTKPNQDEDKAKKELIQWHGDFFDTKDPLVMMFGFFSYEKAQDVLLRAFARLKTPAKLVLAGGARRKSDRPYYDHCQELIHGLGIEDRVFVTHYIPKERVDSYFSATKLAVAPFRTSFGSASLTQSLSRGVPTLASDLDLNQEIDQRHPGSMSFFKSEDPFDASLKIDHLLQHSEELEELGKKGQEYAKLYSPEKIAQMHGAFYESLLSGGSQ